MPIEVPPIDQLRLKGSHNSYDQRRKVSVEDQVEFYGVWVVELDYSIVAQEGLVADAVRVLHPAWLGTPPPCVIGHDGPGKCADDAGPPFAGAPDYLLGDVLARLAQTEAGLYRPLVIYLEKTMWFWGSLRYDDPYYDDPDNLFPLLANVLGSAFGARLFVPDELLSFRAQHDRVPTVRELAGRVIAINTKPLAGSAIFGNPLDPPAPLGPGDIFRYGYHEGCEQPDSMPPYQQVQRCDNFSAPWAWDYAAPPNPLIVDPDTTLANVVACSDDPEQPEWQDGSPHGTRLMPYASVADAAARAGGRLDGGDTGGAAQRGFGFTVLARPGTYGESCRIDFPLMIRPLP